MFSPKWEKFAWSKLGALKWKIDQPPLELRPLIRGYRMLYAKSLAARSLESLPAERSSQIFLRTRSMSTPRRSWTCTSWNPSRWCSFKPPASAARQKQSFALAMGWGFSVQRDRSKACPGNGRGGFCSKAPCCPCCQAKRRAPPRGCTIASAQKTPLYCYQRR